MSKTIQTMGTSDEAAKMPYCYQGKIIRTLL